MPTLRRRLFVLAIGIVALGALAGTLFLPSVQRFFVSRLFPSGPGRTLEFAALEVHRGRIFTTVNPSQPPTLEGRFRIDAGIRGAGTDPATALLGARRDRLPLSRANPLRRRDG